MLAEHRCQHEQAPHAVDDRRNAGEQFDGGADGVAQPARCQFGEEHRDAEAHRHCDQQRDDGADHGAVDRHQRAEAACADIPVGCGEEIQSEGGERLAPAPEHREGRTQQQRQHRHRGQGHGGAKDAIGACVALFPRMYGAGGRGCRHRTHRCITRPAVPASRRGCVPPACPAAAHSPAHRPVHRRWRRSIRRRRAWRHRVRRPSGCDARG